MQYYFIVNKVKPVPTYDQYLTLKEIVVDKMMASNTKTVAAALKNKSSAKKSKRYWPEGYKLPPKVQAKQKSQVKK